MFDFDKDNWGIDASAVMISIASLIRYFFTNFDSWIHSLTGLVALAFVSFRFYVAIKKYLEEKKNGKENNRRLNRWR
jgi:hypothetical protein